MAKAKKTNKKSISPDEYKMKPMVIIILVVVAFIAISLVFIFVIHGDKLDFSKPEGIDCMPPMSESEQACLDAGKCYCATY